MQVNLVAISQEAFEQYNHSCSSAIALTMGSVKLIVVLAVLDLRSHFKRGPAGIPKGPS
jgi:ABC-type sugar transport system permease subunit